MTESPEVFWANKTPKTQEATVSTGQGGKESHSWLAMELWKILVEIAHEEEKKAGKVWVGDLVADHRPLEGGEEFAGVRRKNQGHNKQRGWAVFAVAPTCCPAQ